MLENERPAAPGRADRPNIQRRNGADDTRDTLNAQAGDPWLFDEFKLADAAASAAAYDWLERQGVGRDVLWLGPARFGVTSIAPCNDGTYQPIEQGQHAIIMPALPLAAPWDCDFPSDDIGDLIAWRPEEPGRWWVRVGAVPIMNPAAISGAEIMREPLKVYSTPLAWLRADGDGVVILDHGAELRLWFGGTKEIIAETQDLAREIDRRMREPLVRIPRITFPRKAAA